MNTSMCTTMNTVAVVARSTSTEHHEHEHHHHLASTAAVAAGIMSMSTTFTPTMLSPQSVSIFWRTSLRSLCFQMEERIQALEGVESATITFATKQLRLTAKNPDRYLDQIRKICTSIESEVLVKEKDPKPKAQSPKAVTHPTASKKKFSPEKT